MKQKRFRIWNYAAVFVVTLSVLWLLLFLSALIPNSAIRSNMEQSTLSYKQRDAFEFTREAQLNSVADHYADSIWLNVAWNMGTGEALTASIQTNYYDGEELGKNAGLYYTVMEGVQPNTDYTRYWHGTAAFIRLLHLFTDVEGVKLIGQGGDITLWIPSSMAYGSEGDKQKGIAANAMLRYEVKIVEVKRRR